LMRRRSPRCAARIVSAYAYSTCCTHTHTHTPSDCRSSTQAWGGHWRPPACRPPNRSRAPTAACRCSRQRSSKVSVSFHVRGLGGCLSHSGCVAVAAYCWIEVHHSATVAPHRCYTPVVSACAAGSTQAALTSGGVAPGPAIPNADVWEAAAAPLVATPRGAANRFVTSNHADVVWLCSAARCGDSTMPGGTHPTQRAVLVLVMVPAGP
jgi:hypothetical protein